MTREKTWFDLLYDEYHARGEVMWAFSKEQVEAEGVTWEDFQANWTSLGAGLHVKNAVRVKFVHRMQTDRQEAEAKWPELQVRYVGEVGFSDYPAYRVVGPSAEYGSSGSGRVKVRRDQLLVDAGGREPGKATELHWVSDHDYYEPVDSIEARLVFVQQDEAEREAD